MAAGGGGGYSSITPLPPPPPPPPQPSSQSRHTQGKWLGSVGGRVDDVNFKRSWSKANGASASGAGGGSGGGGGGGGEVTANKKKKKKTRRGLSKVKAAKLNKKPAEEASLAALRAQAAEAALESGTAGEEEAGGEGAPPGAINEEEVGEDQNTEGDVVVAKLAGKGGNAAAAAALPTGLGLMAVAREALLGNVEAAARLDGAFKGKKVAQKQKEEEVTTRPAEEGATAAAARAAIGGGTSIAGTLQPVGSQVHAATPHPSPLSPPSDPRKRAAAAVAPQAIVYSEDGLGPDDEDDEQFAFSPGWGCTS
jgi:hypothetical protein